MIGKAGKYFDELKEEPKSWTEFEKLMRDRFGSTKIDKPSLLIKILMKKQKENENTKSYILEMAKMAEDAEMETNLTIQTIIKNLLHNKTLYRLHLKEKATIHDLIRLVDIIECEEQKQEEFNILDNTNNVSDSNKENEINGFMEKLEKLTLNLNRSNAKNSYRKTNVRCYICNEYGHTQYNS